MKQLTCKYEKGFSLMEVLIAVVIVGLITTSVWSSLFTSAKTRDAVEKKDDFSQMVRIVLERMSRDFKLAFIIPQVKNRTGFVGSSDKVTFTTFAHEQLDPKSKECEQTKVIYELQPDDENPQYSALIRKETKVIKRDFNDYEGRSLKMIGSVSSLKMEYHDGEKFSDRWDHESIETRKKEKIPKAVKISLDVLDHRGNEHRYYTMVNIPLSRLDMKSFNPPSVSKDEGKDDGKDKGKGEEKEGAGETPTPTPKPSASPSIFD